MRDTKTLFPFHYGWIIVVAGGLTVFACLGLARFAYGMLLPGMRLGLQLTYDQMGIISTGNFAGYLLAVGLSPLMIRRFAPRTVIVLGLALLSVFMLLMSRSSGFVPLLGFYFMVGIGSGMANVPMMVLVSYWFSAAARGKAAGFMLIGNGLGIIVSGFLIPFMNTCMGSSEGWKGGWIVLGAICLVITLLVGLAVRNSPRELGLSPLGSDQPAASGLPEAPSTPFPGGLVAHLGILYMIFGATYMVYGTFIVTSMVVEQGFSEASAGHFWAWVGFFSLISGPLFGFISDRFGRKGGFMAVFATQTLAYALAGSSTGQTGLFLSIALYGAAAWGIPTIMTAAVGDYLGPYRAVTGFSIVTFFLGAGQTIGPGSAGFIASVSGSFAACYLASAALTGLGILAAALLPKPETIRAREAALTPEPAGDPL